MIARTWRGAVRHEDRDTYAAYMQDTGVAGYAATPGNRGVWMLRRDLDDVTEFVMFTLWDSMEAVRGFAGDDPETAIRREASEELGVTVGELEHVFDAIDALAATLYLLRQAIQFQVSHLNHAASADWPASQQRLHPHQKFCKGKRFG